MSQQTEQVSPKWVATRLLEGEKSELELYVIDSRVLDKTLEAGFALAIDTAKRIDRWSIGTDKRRSWQKTLEGIREASIHSRKPGKDETRQSLVNFVRTTAGLLATPSAQAAYGGALWQLCPKAPQSQQDEPVPLWKRLWTEFANYFS